MNTALVQVLGAVAYGELKAYEGAKAEAVAATDEAMRLRFRKVAAEELRHHKGFVARLEAMGADPDRAMRPYRTALDTYHGRQPGDPVQEAVFGYLGEGVADDLLQWLRLVVDDETAAFIDTVIEDEVEHEAAAAADLRAALDDTPGGKSKAARASRQMLLHMLWSGSSHWFAPGSALRSLRRAPLRGPTRQLPFIAFLQVGRPAELLGAILGGHARRMKAIGLGPFGLPIPVG